MPQRPSVVSSVSSKSSKTGATRAQSPKPATPDKLHPVVQAALENLDIQLEEELLRYRRSRHRVGEAWRKKLPQGQTATSIPAGDVSYATNPEGEAIAIRPDTAEALAKISARFTPAPASSAASAFDPAPWQATDTVSQPEFNAPEVNLSGINLSGISEPDSQLPDSQLPDSQLPDSQLPDFQMNVVARKATPHLTSDHGLAEHEPTALNLEPEPNLLDTLLTPLGVGSMLLLLVSSATLGFAMMNPQNISILANLGKSKPSPAVSSPAISSPVPQVATATHSAANPLGDRVDTLSLSNLSVLPSGSKQGSLPAAPSSNLPGTANPNAAVTADRSPLPTLPAAPNLSSGLSQSLSTVPVYNSPPAVPEIAYQAEPAPSYSAPSYSAPSYSAPSYSAPSYSAPSYTPPRISYVAPAPRPAPPVEPSYTPPPAAPLPAQSNGDISTISRSEAAPTELDRAYHVDTPYLGDPVLGQAREQAPDAYVYNGDSGANIRASFATEAEAESYSQKLEQQGLSTDVQIGDAVQ